MAYNDRFRSTEEVERLANLKRSVNLVALATERYGLTITEKGAGDNYYKLQNKSTGEVLTVNNAPEGWQQYQNKSNPGDQGSVVDFLQHRHPGANLGHVKRMLTEMAPGAQQELNIDHFRSQQVERTKTDIELSYDSMPAGERREKMVRDTTGQKLSLTDSGYLQERGLSLETIGSPVFAGRVFTDQHPDRQQDRQGAPLHNVGFPFYNEKGIQSWELRNRAPEGQTESFRKMMKAPGDEFGGKNGVWSSNPTQGRGSAVERMVIGESPIDMMSKFQIEQAKARPWEEQNNVRFVATGGWPSFEQQAVIQALINKEQPKQVVLANDNDPAGQAFNVRYLNDLRPPQNGMSVEHKQQSDEAHQRLNWIAGDNGKKGDEKLLTMTVSFRQDSAAEGRKNVEGLREMVRAQGLPSEDPTGQGAIGFQVRANNTERAHVVLYVVPKQAPSLIALAYELREKRESTLPEQIRTPESFLVVERANGKDYNHDLLQARAETQLDDARREAGFAIDERPAAATAAPSPQQNQLPDQDEYYRNLQQEYARQEAERANGGLRASGIVTERKDADLDAEILRENRLGATAAAADFDRSLAQEVQPAPGPIAADINLNGSTSADEIIRADSNRDGVVTDTELTQARFEINQAHQQAQAETTEQTEAERQAEVRRRYEEQRQQAEDEQQAQQQQPQSERDTSGPLRSAGIVIFEVDSLPAGTLAEKMKEAIESTGSEVTVREGRDTTTQQPYAMLAFTYHEGSVEHGQIQQALRDAQALGATKFFGIEPAGAQRETEPVTRTVALNEQALAVALEAPNPLLESQFRATGATVLPELVQEQPALIVVLDTQKAEQLAGLEYVLTKIPEGAQLIESPQAAETRQRATSDYREAGGQTPALEAVAIVGDPRQTGVAEQLREAGATVSPLLDSPRADVPVGSLAVSYPIDQPVLIGRVSVVLDEVAAKGQQIATSLGQAPSLEFGGVIETPLAQLTRQTVARELGLEPQPQRQMPQAQEPQDRAIERVEPVNVLAPPVPVMVEPVLPAAKSALSLDSPIFAVERRVTIDVREPDHIISAMLEKKLKEGGFAQVATVPLEPAGEEKAGTRIQVAYLITDPASVRANQEKALLDAYKGNYVGTTVQVHEPESQVKERALALKSPGQPTKEQYSPEGKPLSAIITVVETTNGESERGKQLWKDLKAVGGQAINITRNELGPDGSTSTFMVNYSATDNRLPRLSDVLNSASRAEGIQVSETENNRYERLARSAAKDASAENRRTPAESQAYVKPVPREYTSANPDAFVQLALTSDDLKGVGGVKELKKQFAETGAAVVVQLLDAEAVGGSTVKVSYPAAHSQREKVEEALQDFAGKGGQIYDLKAGGAFTPGQEATPAVEKAAPALDAAGLAARANETNRDELRTLEARRDMMLAEQREATEKSTAANLAISGPTPLVERAPWVGFGPDLRAENMHNMDASRMDLRGANLSDLDLRTADLRGSDLREANLNGADLRGANLTGTKLEDAVLDGARLEKAFRIVENAEGNKIMQENLTPELLTRPELIVGTAIETGQDRPGEVVPREAERELAAVENRALPVLEAISGTGGLAQPAEVEVRAIAEPAPSFPGLLLPTEAEVKGIAEPAPAPTAEPVPFRRFLSLYEKHEEAGIDLHVATVSVTQPIWGEAGGVPRDQVADRAAEVMARLESIGASVTEVKNTNLDATGSLEIKILSVLYAHDDKSLPALNRVLNELSEPVPGSDHAIHVTDANSEARDRTARERMENTPEAAQQLTAQLHPEDRLTTGVIVSRPSLEDVWALEAAGATVSRIYLPDGPAAQVSYPVAQQDVTGPVSIELDRIERDSQIGRPPHNSIPREISGPLVGEDPVQQLHRKMWAHSEGLDLAPAPRYELHELAEQNARAHSHFREEAHRPNQELRAPLPDGTTWKGKVSELEQLPAAQQNDISAAWAKETTRVEIVVLETPALNMTGAAEQPGAYAQRIAEALRSVGAHAVAAAHGISADTGLDKRVVHVSFANDDPQLARLNATLANLAEQPGVAVSPEGAYQRERVLGPMAVEMAEPVMVERERPWLEATAILRDSTPEERRALNRAGASVEETTLIPGQSAVLVKYDLDNPRTVAGLSETLGDARQEGRVTGEFREAISAQEGRREQFARAQDTERGISGEALERQAQRVVAGPEVQQDKPQSFIEKLQAVVNHHLAEFHQGWEAGTPERMAIYEAEQRGNADRLGAIQAAKEKEAYDRGFAGPQLEVGAIALPTAGTAAEVRTDQVLRERRDDERTAPVVMDAPKESKVLDTQELVKPGMAAQPGIVPVIDPALIAAAEKAHSQPNGSQTIEGRAARPEPEWQHGTIRMGDTEKSTGGQRLDAVREKLQEVGANVGFVVPAVAGQSTALLTYSYKTQGPELEKLNVVLFRLEHSPVTQMRDEPHPLQHPSIVPNSHAIPIEHWPQREGQFAQAHIVIDDQDHRGAERADKLGNALRHDGANVSNAKSDGHGHVEMDVSYHTRSPGIEQVSATLDSAGRASGIEVQETALDRSARYRGAADQAQTQTNEQQQERE